MKGDQWGAIQRSRKTTGDSRVIIGQLRDKSETIKNHKAKLQA